MLSQSAHEDHYWRLHKHHMVFDLNLRRRLEEVGVPQKTIWMNDSDVFWWAHKIDLGHLLYSKCRIKELQKLIKDRRLGPLEDPIQKDTLIWILERADEDATFDRFMDFPPELRALVASFYMAGFGDRTIANAYKNKGVRYQGRKNEFEWEDKSALLNPTQPPLTRTCRALRTEMLPLFYSTCIFGIMLDYKHEAGYSKRAICRISAGSLAWLMTLGPENMKWLRQIRFRVDRSVWTSGAGNIYELRIGPNQGVVKKFIWNLAGSASFDVLARESLLVERVVKALQKVLELIESREAEEANHLRLDDIYAIRREIERASDGS